MPKLKVTFDKTELNLMPVSDLRTKLFDAGFSIKYPYSIFFDEIKDTVTYEQEIPDAE